MGTISVPLTSLRKKEAVSIPKVRARRGEKPFVTGTAGTSLG
jgi:hypothetical protein